MKNSKKIALGAALLIIAFAAFFLLYQNFAPQAVKGHKKITVTVVHGDGEKKEFPFQTDEEFLGAVLLKEKLAEGEVGQYGLFITTVDKETADDAKQQWWRITKGGEQVNTGADQTPIADGDAFELTLIEGYD